MKSLHVVDKNTYLSFTNRMSESHYIDLDATHVLVVCDFSSASDEDFWGQLPAVQSLPHPLSGKNISNHPDFAKLQQVLGATASDSTFDLMEKARKIHPLMRF